MKKKPSQNNPETNTTGTNSFNDVPDDAVFTILPFLGLNEMGKLSLVDKISHKTITDAFTNPNMYTAYPGMFEALCKFWHENRVAFNKWFKLYRIDKIQTAPHGVNQRDQACDYIFKATFQTTYGVHRKKLNNALKMVFQNNTDDITQFLLPLVSNANQFALYRTFGNTTLQEILEAQIATWTDTTAASRENIHTLLFCLLSSKDIKFFNSKHCFLTNMLDYAEKNMNEIFGQETIRKYGEGFIKALLQSCRLTLDAANGTKPTAEKINAIRKAFPNIPINFAGANLTGAHLTSAHLSYARLMGAALSYARLMGANLTYANLTMADLRGADLMDAGLIGANLTGADLSRAYLRNADLGGANLKYADLRNANLTGADLRGANLFGCTFSPNTKLEGIKIDSTSLLRVFIDGRNPQNATTNIWSLCSEEIDTFKRLLPHAEIKELQLLMEGAKEIISVHFLDFIFGALEKAKLLKLISDEIAKKQASQKMECEKPTQKESISGNSQQQNSSAINSTLESPKQSGNTISFNP